MRTPYAPAAGLCETCANVRIVDTRKGSRFYMCQLSEVDPRFPRYPRTPVLQCMGYAPAPAPDAVPAGVPEPG